MSISHDEAVASLHVLVAVAQADGTLHDEERKALEAGLKEVGLDGEISPQELFDDSFSLDEQVKLLGSGEAREETFKSAYSLAWADGDCSDVEKKLLAKLRVELGVSAQREAELEALFADQAEKKSAYSFIADPVERKKAITSETRKCAIVSAAFGAVPFPGIAILSDLAVIALQVMLVRDIGAMSGREVSKKAAKKILAGFGVGTGARIALSNIAKLLPGWGSLVGATAAFASTWALGRVVGDHMAEGDEIDAEALAKEFDAAKAEGKKAYDANKDEVDAIAKKAEIQEVLTDLKDGKVDAFESRVSHLG